jgi:hypothetical protein
MEEYYHPNKKNKKNDYNTINFSELNELEPDINQKIDTRKIIGGGCDICRGPGAVCAECLPLAESGK